MLILLQPVLQYRMNDFVRILSERKLIDQFRIWKIFRKISEI